ncbi:MAG: hypothetical protein HRU38_12470 [Saccharospirillaceae bacterium]|nr:hypothetical protein [Pseudomonadales bacterium]NRB79461.1 hypothetical protein [Saccharospirillaceae bacterium]
MNNKKYIYETKNVTIDFGKIAQKLSHYLIGCGLVILALGLTLLTIIIAKIIFTPMVNLFVNTSVGLVILILFSLIMGGFLLLISYLFTIEFLDGIGIKLNGWTRYLIILPSIPIMCIGFFIEIKIQFGESIKNKKFAIFSFILGLLAIVGTVYFAMHI